MALMMPEYSSEEVAWAALALSLFLLLLFVIYVTISSCDLCVWQRHHQRVIRHIIVTPQTSHACTSIKAQY